ncbi:MAG: glutamyl-tRNA reductase [Nostocoides sp.]
MSLLVVGISHHRADAAALERVSLAPQQRRTLGERILAGEAVNEALVLSTCNRTEVYADAVTFHGAIAELLTVFVELTGGSREELADWVYVHYEDRAIAHAFSVAGGLDSMAVGEAQILGQVKEALRDAQSWGQVGPALNTLGQQALRVGKRIHTETAIDDVSVSLVEAGLALAARHVGPVAKANVVVIGAGGMASLAASTAHRQGVTALSVLNRTFVSAERLAARTEGRARPWNEFQDAVAEADIVLTATGAGSVVVTSALVQRVMEARPERRLALIDLALPHDVDTGAGKLPGVVRIGLDDLRDVLTDGREMPEVEAAAELVTGEVAAFLTARAADDVAPTVRALRARAAEVVSAELDRLDRRVVGLTAAQRAEVDRTVHRIVEKLLHTPTVRVKELAGADSGRVYAEALRELFELDPHVAASVTAPPTDRGAP